MTEQGATSQRLTVAEAAAALGVSRMTVRRMIQRGQLEAERVHRPQGTAFMVALPGDDTDQGTPTAQSERHAGRPNGTGTGTSAELMAAWSETFLGPIMMRMTEQETIIRELERENGRLTTELAVARAPQSPPEVPGAPPPVDPAPRPLADRFRTWAPWVLLAAILVLAVAVGQPAWVR